TDLVETEEAPGAPAHTDIPPDSAPITPADPSESETGEEPLAPVDATAPIAPGTEEGTLELASGTGNGQGPTADHGGGGGGGGGGGRGASLDLALGVIRAGVGAALMAAPAWAGRVWVGPGADGPGSLVFARAVG